MLYLMCNQLIAIGANDAWLTQMIDNSSSSKVSKTLPGVYKFKLIQMDACMP